MRAAYPDTLTLEQLCPDQGHLTSLCAPRAVTTSEIFTPNAFYGIDRILKAYAGLPESYSLKAVVPHGISFSDDGLSNEAISAPVPAVLCYPPYREPVYAVKTRKAVVQSASPFLYLLKLLQDQGRSGKNNRKGTVFFPAHSTALITAHMDYESLAEELAGLEGQLQPVTVCIYWRDYNLGRHVPFQERGLKVVSAGHRADPRFLTRLYHICSLHRYASSNHLGSHLFYAVKAGCSFFFLDADVEASYLGDPDHLKQHYFPASTRRESALKALFTDPTPRPTREQLEAVDYYLGAAYLKSPEALRRQLRHFELLDRFGLVVRNEGQAPTFVVPALYARGFQRLKKMWTTSLRPRAGRVKRELFR